jgi:hypothetical protein
MVASMPSRMAVSWRDDRRRLMASHFTSLTGEFYAKRWCGVELKSVCADNGALCRDLGGRKQFFFEKKNQKTFSRFGARCRSGRVNQRAKVFWFFFSKKNCFLAVPALRVRAATSPANC